MTRITVKFIGSGTSEDPYRVNLPNYRMIGDADYVGKTVQVEVPDDELTKDKGRPDAQRIREKYRGQQDWDRANVVADV